MLSPDLVGRLHVLGLAVTISSPLAASSVLGPDKNPSAARTVGAESATARNGKWVMRIVSRKCRLATRRGCKGRRDKRRWKRLREKAPSLFGRRLLQTVFSSLTILRVRDGKQSLPAQEIRREVSGQVSSSRGESDSAAACLLNSPPAERHHDPRKLKKGCAPEAHLPDCSFRNSRPPAIFNR